MCSGYVTPCTWLPELWYLNIWVIVLNRKFEISAHLVYLGDLFGQNSTDCVKFGGIGNDGTVLLMSMHSAIYLFIKAEWAIQTQDAIINPFCACTNMT